MHQTHSPIRYVSFKNVLIIHGIVLLLDPIFVAKRLVCEQNSSLKRRNRCFVVTNLLVLIYVMNCML